ncbi:hypothetical protein DERP_013887 [Dermatophagoides pteronyssinus]|uniref:Uncharacterized protein n=1 Tax=Dermatophagoides pteronyssinus TaxID=6956 RepID=A0ABQ8J2W0_DERPT|nr:hypothetical protein DERP_013887 [Dermatophagoides pteronyssinus]
MIMLITLSTGLRPKNCRFNFIFLQSIILILLQAITVIKCSSYGHKTSSSSLHTATPIKAAINSHHIVNHYEIDTPKEPYKPNLIEVKSSVPMFHIKFTSASSKVNVFHQHESSKGNKEPIESFSEDEPHILRHQVVKPIVQQIHEIITPVRKVVQEIKPVVETIDSIISRSSSSSSKKSMSNRSTMSNGLSKTRIKSSTPSSSSSSSQLSSPNSNIDQQDIQQHKAFIGDLTSWLSSAARKPDLLVSNENEIFDNSLYNGANEYDLKYPSQNSVDIIIIK